MPSLTDILYFLAGCVCGLIGMFFIYRNNVKTANAIAATAKNDLAIAQSTISQLRGATTKPAA